MMPNTAANAVPMPAPNVPTLKVVEIAAVDDRHASEWVKLGPSCAVDARAFLTSHDPFGLALRGLTCRSAALHPSFCTNRYPTPRLTLIVWPRLRSLLIRAWITLLAGIVSRSPYNSRSMSDTGTTSPGLTDSLAKIASSVLLMVSPLAEIPEPHSPGNGLERLACTGGVGQSSYGS